MSKQFTIFDSTPRYDEKLERCLARARSVARRLADDEILAALDDIIDEGCKRLWERRRDARSSIMATVAWMMRDHHQYGRSLYRLPDGDWTRDIERAVSARLEQIEGEA